MSSDLNAPDWTAVRMNSPVHPFPGEPNSTRVQNIPGRDQRPPEPNMPLTALTPSIAAVVFLCLTSHSLSIAIKKKTNVHMRQTLLIIHSQERGCCIHTYTHSLSSCYVLVKHSFSGWCMSKFNENAQKSSSGSRWKQQMQNLRSP